MSRRRDAVVRRGFRHIGLAVREQPGMFALAVAASSLYSAMTVASAYVIGEITDRVVLQRELAEIRDLGWAGSVGGRCSPPLVMGWPSGWRSPWRPRSGSSWPAWS